MSSYVEQGLADAGITDAIESDRFFPTVRAAVEYCVRHTDLEDQHASDASPV